MGSSPSMDTKARLAQLVERKTFNLVVVGSSPTVGKGEWRSGLARVAHNHEVGCSIHPSPNSSIAQLAERSAVNR